MWNHLDGFPNEERMRNLFWHYLNYGNTNTVKSISEINALKEWTEDAQKYYD